MTEERIDFSRIIETTSKDEVNEYLKKGWKLITTGKIAERSIPDGECDQLILYSLGEPVQPVQPERRVI